MTQTNQPRDRPILFSGPMVRAIIDGRKTMTRRLRFIKLEIVANGRYCDNECAFMASDAKSCSLFGALSWHRKKRSNGNIRPRECRRAENAYLDAVEANDD